MSTGEWADVYRVDGTLKKHYQAQFDRLGLMPVKAVADSSYTVHVYTVRQDYMPPGPPNTLSPAMSPTKKT